MVYATNALLERCHGEESGLMNEHVYNNNNNNNNNNNIVGRELESGL